MLTQNKSVSIKDKAVFLGTVYLVSIYAAYSVGVEQTKDNCKQQKVVTEYVSPKVKCTYPKIVTTQTPCQQWNRITSK